MCRPPLLFFFNDTATTEIYTLSLHDALPIYGLEAVAVSGGLLELLLVRGAAHALLQLALDLEERDRKSTRLNSSHTVISYAVFCLKKKKKTKRIANRTPDFSAESVQACRARA